MVSDTVQNRIDNAVNDVIVTSTITSEFKATLLAAATAKRVELGDAAFEAAGYLTALTSITELAASLGISMPGLR